MVLWRDALGELFVLRERDGFLSAPLRGGLDAGTLFRSGAAARAAVARSREVWRDSAAAYVVRAVR